MAGEHVLDLGRPYHVYVSYYQSPAKFWVQVADDVHLLEELHEQITEYQKNNTKEPHIGRGRLVWARHRESGEGSFYRARIDSVQSSGQCKVYFIDYGNTDVLSASSDIRELPSRFAVLPAQAIECSLSTAVSFIEDFNRLTELENLYVSTSSVTDEGLHLVDLGTSPTAFQTSPRRGGGDYSNGGSNQGSSFYAPLQFNLAGYVDVCVSCVEDSGCFYCQLIEQAQSLKDLMYDIQNAYDNDSAYVTQPKPNLPCIVQDVEDGIYYRAKILSTEGTSVRVKYVDFGSTAVVPISCLRQILDEHIILPAQSIKCSLDGADQLNVGAVVKLLKQYESNIPLVLKVMFKTAGHYEVELIDTNGNDDYSLVDLLKTGDAALPKQSQRFKTTSIKLLVRNPDVRINDEEKVFVSAVLTDRCFFGQLCKYDVNILEQMTDELSELYSRDPGQRVDPSIGGICCTKFSEDHRFYRSKIIDMQGPKAKVFFIDYGNQEWKEFNELYELVVEHYSLPQQGIKCELKETYSREVTEAILDELLIDNEVVVKLESRHGDTFTVSVPECADNDAIAPKINVFLQQRQPQNKGVPMVKSSVSATRDQAMEFRKPPVRPGQSLPVIVTHVDSPDQFYCQLKDSLDQLNQLMDAIADYSSRLLPTQGLVEETFIGMPCLALYSSDSVWYRALVTGMEASGAIEVQFVDYGNHERMQRNRLRIISNEFMQLPMQAVPSSMLGIGCRPGDMWTQEESDKFFELSSSESITMNVVEFSPGQNRFIIQLLEGDINLNKMFGQMTGKVIRPQPATSAGMAPRPIRGTGSTMSVNTPPKTQGMDLGAFYKAYVVYALGPGKFYCQLEDQGDTLESFMADLNREYNKLTPNERGLQQPVEGMACCTVYPEDQRWHRAVITSVKGSQSEVRFIDYGNTEMANTSQLKELTGRHVLVPEFAFECSLHGVKSATGPSWSEDAGYQFEQVTLEKLMVLCVKEQTSPGVYQVELVDNATNQSVGDQMVALGFASKDSPPVRSPAGRTGGLARRAAQASNTGPSRTDPNTTIVSITFSVNSEYDVLMGHVNSPQQFWCQPAEHADALEAMMDKLEADYNNLSPGDLKVHHPWMGQVVAARFTVDQRWYRAEIISIERSEVKVKYVDYGNSEWLSPERVRVLKSEYTSLPRQAVECSLEGVYSAEPEWPEGAISTFEDITYEKDLIFKVTKMKGKIYHGSLFQKETGKIVENILVKQGLVQIEDDAGSVESSTNAYQPSGRPITKSLSPKPTGSAPLSRTSSSSAEEVPPFRKQKLASGERFKCQISWVNDPLDFFCQRLDAEELLAEQMESMNEFYNSLSGNELGLPNPTVGQPCVARYSADENWYRARIAKIRGNEARVLFVDYGNSERVQIPKVKHVAKEFRALPEQAIHCGIEGIEKPSTGWNQQVAGLFQQLCAQQVMCSVISQNDKVTLVRLDDSNNQSVGTQLVNLGVPASPSGSLAGAGKQGGFSGQPRFGGQDDRPQRGFGAREDRPPRGLGSGSNDGDRPQRGFGSGSNDGDRPQKSFGGADRPRRGFGDDDSQSRGRRFDNESGDRRGRFGNDDRDQKPGGRFSEHDDRRGGFGSNDGRRGGFGSNDRRGGRFGDAQDSQGGRFGRDSHRDGGGFGQGDRSKEFGNRSGGFGGSSGFGAATSSAGAAAGGDDWGDDSPAAAAASPSSVFQSTETVKSSCYKSLDQNQLLVGVKIKAEIVHAESTAEFWIQLSGHMDKLDGLMDKLEERYSQATGDLYTLKNPSAGSPCVAKYTVDGGWYRAKVLSVTPQKLHVFFVDYGNTDWVPRSHVKDLNKECAELAMQAMRCSLAGVEFSSPEATKEFNELTEKKTLIVEIKDHLPSNGISVLIKDELGTSINDAVKEILSSTTYPPAGFKRGTEIEAVVSHVNSPGSFYVQKADQLDDLATMADAMLTTYDDLASCKLMETAAVGFPCIAKYSEDGAYYRGVVSSVNSTKAVITFIDYGNQDTVEANSIRIPSAEHLAIPAFAVHCHFAGLPTTGWSDKDRESLDTLAAVDSLTVVLEDEKVPAGAVIMVNGEKLNDKFKNPSAPSTVPVAKTMLALPADVVPPVMTLDTIYPPAKPQTNTPLPVFVCHANSPNSFYVQLASDEDAIAELAEKIQVSYCSLSPTDLILENHFEGKACVAKFSEDEAWYRAFITKLQGSKVTVRFIDYGNSDTIDRTTLKSPTAELASLPCYAIHCSLAGVSLTADQKEEVLTVLNDADDSFMMSVMSIGNPCKVKLVAGALDLNAKYGACVVETSKTESRQEFLPPSVLVGKEISVFSTHAKSPTDFYLQLSELEEQTTALADKLVEEYGALNNGDRVLSSPEVGSSCVAKYDEDENWYRGRVMSISGETCEVLFVDYGNSATVPVSGLKVPSDELLKIPIMAVHSSLQGVEEASWTEELKEKFNELIMDAEIAAKFINDQQQPVPVKLIQDGKDLAEMFVKSEFEVEESSSVSQPAPEPEETTAVIQNQVYPPPCIPVGNEVQVYCTQSESPADFYLQLTDLEEKLTALADTLVSEYGSLNEGDQSLKDPEVGSCCVAKFDEDESWYRATVKSISEDVCEVLFVDYGNSATVAVSGLKVPSSELLNKPVMAVPCALSVVAEGSWNDELKTQFNEIVTEAELIAQFLDDKQQPVPVKLRHEDKDLADIFRKSEPKTVIEESTAVEQEASNEESAVNTVAEDDTQEVLKIGEKLQVVVTHIDHPSLFWVRPASAEAKIESLSETLRERYDNTTVESAEHSLDVGDLIVTKYDDDEWYRAKVVEVTGEQATVYFSDYGNTDMVSLNRVYPASDDLLVLPSQACQCLLAGVSAPGESWSEEAVEAFQDLVLEKKVLSFVQEEIEVQNGASKAFAVKLLNVGISAADKLVKGGHALVSEHSVYVEGPAESGEASEEIAEVNEQQQTVSESPAEVAKTEEILTDANPASTELESYDSLMLPLNKEIEVFINCVHIPDGLFDVYPSEKSMSDDVAQCRLITVLPEEDDWSTELQTFFCDFIDKKVVVRALQLEDGIYTVEMFDAGVSVGEILQQKNLLTVATETQEEETYYSDDNLEAQRAEQTEEENGMTGEELLVESTENAQAIREIDDALVGTAEAEVVVTDEPTEVVVTDENVISITDEAGPSESLANVTDDVVTNITNEIEKDEPMNCVPSEAVSNTPEETSALDKSDEILAGALEITREEIASLDDENKPVPSEVVTSVLNEAIASVPIETDDPDVHSETDSETSETNDQTKVGAGDVQNGEVSKAEMPKRIQEAGDQPSQELSDNSTTPLFPTYERDSTLVVQYVRGVGPEKFICKLDHEEEQTKLAGLLEAHYANDNVTVLPRTSATVGQLCVVKTSGSPTFCRGVLVDVGENDCKVNLVDYGKLEEVANTSLFQFPEQFLTTAAQCVTMQLHGVITQGDDTQEYKVGAEGSGDNNRDAGEQKDISLAFLELCRAGPLVATVVSKAGSGVDSVYQVVLCNREGVNINSEVVSKSHAWVAPVSSLAIDPADYERFAEEQDVLEDSFLEVSCMKDNSIGDMDVESDDADGSLFKDAKEEANELDKKSTDETKEMKEFKTGALDHGDKEKNHNENCNKDAANEENHDQEAAVDS